MPKPVKRPQEPKSAADGKQLVDRGKRVLALEAAAVQRLADTLGPAFARAVEILAGVTAGHRVIVSGIGKSGLIARKIAEGCDRNCGFCAIPSFRGRQRSRTVE